ncbi:MAG: DNA primase, partial [Alphaproteobacteria bacterium]|nr:DNA primase [Alphaproteobacteria bacterium]
MAFPPRFLDDLRLKVSLASVIGKKVKLTKRGNEYIGLCPFHKEKTPSFTLNEEKGFYHCFGCGAHGDAISFLINCERLSFMEAVEHLAQMAGMEVPKSSPQEAQKAAAQNSLYETMEKACRFFEQKLYEPEGKEALDYLHKRGLTDQDIHHFRLGYAPLGNQLRTTLLKQNCSEKDLIALGLVHKSSQAGRENYDYFHDRIMFSIADRRNH